MTEQWEKQQREVDSYNVFFSAFKGRTEVDSPYNYDYRLAGMFVEIPDPFTVGRCNHVIRDTARNAY